MLDPLDARELTLGAIAPVWIGTSQLILGALAPLFSYENCHELLEDRNI